MTKRMAVLALTLLATCAGTTVTGAAPDGLERHSGTVVTIDRGRDLIVVDETGWWNPATEQAQRTRNRIYVTGLTEFKVVVRSSVRGGYSGDFAETELRMTALAPGDTVTAECVRSGGALVAMSIVVADAQ